MHISLICYVGSHVQTMHACRVFTQGKIRKVHDVRSCEIVHISLAWFIMLAMGYKCLIYIHAL